MKINKRQKIAKGTLYDYTCKESREDTVKFLFDYTREQRSGLESYWSKMKNYYSGTHDTAKQMGEMLGSIDLPWMPAQSTDGYIHVESQIDVSVPDFEFGGRGREDNEKAEQREKIVRYIVDKNNLEQKNSRNERRLGIYGTAVWKIIWDRSMNRIGNVYIDNPSPTEIFPDPHGVSVESCEYIAHSYRLHKSHAKRLFVRELEAGGMGAEEIDALLSKKGADYGSFYGDSGMLDSGTYDDSEQTVNILEWWFRQPDDGELAAAEGTYKWKAGDVGLCVHINGFEVRYIPKYWNNTDNNQYPFVFYNKTPNENSIWGKSELEALIPLIDAADRELAFAQLNSAFMSNDIIIAEENAFADDHEPENKPGAIWKLRPGMMGRVQRLGNISYAEGGLYANAERFRRLMQETSGNFDVYQGAQPTRVTTATGIALLNEQARVRQDRKKIDRQKAFEKLYLLCDMTALEYFDDGRVIAIGAAGTRSGKFVYSYAKIAGEDNYIPELDIKIHLGDGLKNSKAYTISALSEIMRMPINEDNAALIKMFISLIDIPQSVEICDYIEKKYLSEEVQK